MQKVQVSHLKRQSQVHLLAVFSFARFQKQKWQKTIFTPEILILPLNFFLKNKRRIYIMY